MMKEKNRKIGVRLASMLLDHLIMTFGLVLIAVILFAIGFLIFKNPSESEPSGLLAIFPLIFGLFIFSIYFNKDAIKGKSPAKRILGLIIVDNKTGLIAGPIKAVIRNITLFLWPIEVIFSIFSPERRIGDYIAGTKVITDDNTLSTNIKIGQIIVGLIIGAFILFPLIFIQLALNFPDVLEF